jgi:hypothetical protein
MPLPRPEPGLVIHYEYLWQYESERGQETGAKSRPCAIIVAVTGETGQIETVVAPITHSEPRPPAEGVEIPGRVKRSLGLDDDRSWVIVTDLNTFVWPGIDIYPVPRTPSGTYEYGHLPPKLFDQIRDRITAIGSWGKATRRTE